LLLLDGHGPAREGTIVVREAAFYVMQHAMKTSCGVIKAMQAHKFLQEVEQLQSKIENEKD
jgi:hypothetical protein